MFDTAGFHEAVGDTIALSVSTPQHLQKVGLLQNYTDTEEDNINALMQIALQKVRVLRGPYTINHAAQHCVLCNWLTVYGAD
jgi:peptidyl-dipeptidase A